MLKKLDFKELEITLTEFISDVKKHFTIEEAILYGSYAKGDATELSDIDLLIVSSDLPIKSSKGMNGYRILSKLSKVYPSIELIANHPDNLSNEVNGWFYDEIKSSGRVLYKK